MGCQDAVMAASLSQPDMFQPKFSANLPLSCYYIYLAGGPRNSKINETSFFLIDAGNVHCLCGYVSTVAGQSGHQGIHDGPGPIAQFSTPASLWCLPNGDVYVGDTGERALRLIHSSQALPHPLLPGVTLTVNVLGIIEKMANLSNKGDHDVADTAYGREKMRWCAQALMKGCKEDSKGTADLSGYVHLFKGVLAAGALGLVGWAAWSAFALKEKNRKVYAGHRPRALRKGPLTSNLARAPPGNMHVFEGAHVAGALELVVWAPRTTTSFVVYEQHQKL
eukprot:1139718-Pelagomonas_calceolata.AAC.2